MWLRAASSGPVIRVDPTFRDQFAITRPTPRYTAVLEALPAVFVCQIDQVRPIVELLCSLTMVALRSTAQGLCCLHGAYAESHAEQVAAPARLSGCKVSSWGQRAGRLLLPRSFRQQGARQCPCCRGCQLVLYQQPQG